MCATLPQVGPQYETAYTILVSLDLCSYGICLVLAICACTQMASGGNLLRVIVLGIVDRLYGFLMLSIISQLLNLLPCLICSSPPQA